MAKFFQSLLAASLSVAVVASAPASAQADAGLNAALNGAQRSAENKARDQYRHPAETLVFFGIKPTMTVVEIAPGEGWYTEILAPYLRDQGKLVVAPGTLNGPGRSGLGATLTKLGSDAKVYDKVEVVDYAPTLGVVGVKPGSADMVVLFRHMHGRIYSNNGPQSMKLYFDALKPGGILGIEQHRLPENRARPEKITGYIKESELIKLAEDAGFKFAGKSEINANPKDTADWPSGVWTLPPTLQLGDKDKAKYLAIGESDRMTLKFVKP